MFLATALSGFGAERRVLDRVEIETGK